jgi:nucleoside-diphosphate-sugar epimerase
MILITGANGRIGKKLVARLLKDGEKVRAFVRKAGRKRKNLEFFEGDICDAKSLKMAMKDVKAVYHLAAIVDYTKSKKEMMAANVLGTKNILEAAGKRKVIHMSSTAVMGKKLQKIPADEKTYCKPTNIYGQTKLEAEKLAISKDAVVIRSADVYGKEFKEGFFQIIDSLKRKKLLIVGNGKNQLQFVHISDLIDALILAKDKGKRGRIYIITGKDIVTQEELITLTCKLLRISAPDKKIPLELAKFLARVKGIQSKVKKKKPVVLEEYIDKLAANRVFNIERAREELGYDPKIKYEIGIKEVVDEFKKCGKRFLQKRAN